MKNILVPTDFSDCAYYAIDAASQLAKRFNAKLHILYSQDLPPYWDNLPKNEKEKWVQVQQSHDQASLEFEKIRNMYPDVLMEISVTSKPLPDAITQWVENNGIELIVIGSHGTSGKNEFFIGSNTQKVIRTVHCPALVIKNPLDKVEFRRVVYASSFQESELEGFLYFKKLIKHFIPEVHLVYIQHSVIHPPPPVQFAAMKPFEKACAPLKCHSHIYNDISVDSGVRSFAEKLNADLIAISYHERHPIKRMLIGSNVEAIINHADLPVLTVDFKT